MANYLLDQLVKGLRRSVEEEIAGPLVPVVRRPSDQNRIDRLISRFGFQQLSRNVKRFRGSSYLRLIDSCITQL